MDQPPSSGQLARLGISTCIKPREPFTWAVARARFALVDLPRQILRRPLTPARRFPKRMRTLRIFSSSCELPMTVENGWIRRLTLRKKSERLTSPIQTASKHFSDIQSTAAERGAIGFASATGKTHAPRSSHGWKLVQLQAPWESFGTAHQIRSITTTRTGTFSTRRVSTRTKKFRHFVRSQQAITSFTLATFPPGERWEQRIATSSTIFRFLSIRLALRSSAIPTITTTTPDTHT